MNSLISLHDEIFGAIERQLGSWIVPILARVTFLGVLFVYYWNSATTKLGSGALGWLFPSDGAYIQMFPKAMESAGYSAANLPAIYWPIAVAGTWAEFILPVLIIIGLATRMAALGMIGFVFVQSYVDVFGHGLAERDIGAWFDNQAYSLIFDQRAFWMFLLVTLVVKGAGPLSLDSIMRHRQPVVIGDNSGFHVEKRR